MHNQSRLVKICGNRYADDSFEVASLEPDFMGWIFSHKSSRTIPVMDALRIIKRIKIERPGILHVGVFAGNPIPEVIRILEAGVDLDFLQVVEGSGYIGHLRDFLGKRKKFSHFTEAIIPAIRVKGKLDSGDLSIYGNSPFFILDAYVPGSAGGTGQRFELKYIEDVIHPAFVAGGLNPENVRSVLLESGCIGADVSSGVEDGTPGRKNMKLVESFIREVRSVSGKPHGADLLSAIINEYKRK